MAGMMTGLLLLLLVGVTVGRVVDLQKRIIGGKECAADDRPYHVKLHWTSPTHESMCGGSLISENWILTAAHCVEPGTLTAHLRVPPGAKEEIVVITAAPTIKTGHDIMLLELPKAMKGFETVSLPECDKRPLKVQIAGHGPTEKEDDNARRNFKDSDTLQCADTTVVGCERVMECLHNDQDYTSDNQHLICFKKDNVDSSVGDSGGGVVFNKMIYGVISFTANHTHACTEPAAAMDVCKYKAWIEGVTGKSFPK